MRFPAFHSGTHSGTAPGPTQMSEGLRPDVYVASEPLQRHSDVGPETRGGEPTGVLLYQYSKMRSQVGLSGPGCGG